MDVAFKHPFPLRPLSTSMSPCVLTTTSRKARVEATTSYSAPPSPVSLRRRRSHTGDTIFLQDAMRLWLCFLYLASCNFLICRFQLFISPVVAIFIHEHQSLIHWFQHFFPSVVAFHVAGSNF
ncbi:hypothetical protein VPH35_008516 [Triticum aestivum]